MKLLAGYFINGVSLLCCCSPSEIQNTLPLTLPLSPSKTMDYIKSSLGYGSQSGQEPIAGEVGKGTADQPYDAGNTAGMMSYLHIGKALN